MISLTAIIFAITSMVSCNPALFQTEKRPYHLPTNRPIYQNVSAMARYVLHTSEWGSLATISTHKGIEDYPFNNIFSVSDGPVDQSTGIPYFYLTKIELSIQDLKKNPKASLTLTEAQSGYCEEQNLDPQDPLCAHIIYTGTIKVVQNETEEGKFAKLALFSRHNEMNIWPKDHGWFFAKLVIEHIYVLDFFGGAKVIDLEEYYRSNPF